MRASESAGEAGVSDGPGLPTVVLDEGVVSLETFTAELEKKKATREELLEAERLFELDRTSYPELVEAEKELGELAEVYAVYVAHKQALDAHAGTLWAELDLKKLHAVSKDFTERVESMAETALGKKPVFELVEERVAAFKNSLPLMEALKSDALRPRHWAQLVRITRQPEDFDVDPKTFTLGALFGLELHRFHEPVMEMCIAAEKELKIRDGMLVMGVHDATYVHVALTALPPWLTALSRFSVGTLCGLHCFTGTTSRGCLCPGRFSSLQ